MIKYLNIKERHKLKMKDQIKKLENIILKGDEWNAHSSEIDYIKDEIKECKKELLKLNNKNGHK